MSLESPSLHYRKKTSHSFQTLSSFSGYCHKRKVWETETMNFTQSRFQAPNGKDVTLDSG